MTQPIPTAKAKRPAATIDAAARRKIEELLRAGTHQPPAERLTTRILFETRSRVHEMVATIEKDSAGTFSYRVPYHQIHQTWLQTPIDETWIAALRIVPKDGQPVVAELRIFPNHPDRQGLFAGEWAAEVLDQADIERSDLANFIPEGGLTVSKVRKVRLGALREQYGKILRNWEKRAKAEGHTISDLLAAGGWQQATGPQEPHRGRPRTPDTYFAEIAALYVQALEQGSTHPNIDVANELGRIRNDFVTSKMVRGWLLEARRRRLLTKPAGGRGHLGGQLTDKGLAALKRGTRDGKH